MDGHSPIKQNSYYDMIVQQPASRPTTSLKDWDAFHSISLTPCTSTYLIKCMGFERQTTDFPEATISSRGKSRYLKPLSSIKPIVGSTKDSCDILTEHPDSLQQLSPLSRHILNRYTNCAQRAKLATNNSSYSCEIAFYDIYNPHHDKTSFFPLYEHDSQLWCHLLCTEEITEVDKNALRSIENVLTRVTVTLGDETQTTDNDSLEWDGFF